MAKGLSHDELLVSKDPDTTVLGKGDGENTGKHHASAARDVDGNLHALTIMAVYGRVQQRLFICVSYSTRTRFLWRARGGGVLGAIFPRLPDRQC